MRITRGDLDRNTHTLLVTNANKTEQIQEIVFDTGIDNWKICCAIA